MVEQKPDLEPLAPLHGQARVTGDFIRMRVVAEVFPSFRSGDFIVAGVDFGSDGPLATALESIRAAGVAAVIARSFAGDFERAATALGIPALIVEETAAILSGDRLRVDIEGHKIANLSSGDRYVIRNAYDEQLDILRAGGLASYRKR